MAAFPSVAHVAVTVTDLERSTRWYSSLFGAEPALDEDEGSGFHHTVYVLGGGQLFGLHTHDMDGATDAFDEHRTAPGWTTWPSPARTGPSWRGGRPAWTSWASPTAR